ELGFDEGVSEPPPDPRARWSRAFTELRRLLLGFDLDPGDGKRVVGSFLTLSGALPPDDPALLRAEQEVLSIFADIHALFHRQPLSDGPDGPDARSTQEYLHNYLRAPGMRGEGLPRAFLDKLSCALAHYDVRSLERAPLLEDALLRIYSAQE